VSSETSRVSPPAPTSTAPAGQPVPYAEALGLVLRHVLPLPAETVPLDRALGAYLAEPARARSHSPRFEQSAMDGWAVRVADLAGATAARPVSLRVAGSLPAGTARRQLLKPGATIRVFTGSPLPGGAEAVVVQEVVGADGETAVFRAPARAGANLRRVGEEYRRGDVLLPSGCVVTPPVLGLLAQLGRAAVKVGGRPAALVITMGDELVEPGVKPGRAQVIDANGPAICAALRAAGARAVRHVRVPDDPTALRRALAQGLRGADLVVTVGGASVGDHDHVPAVRAQLGIRELFGRVAIRPGLPNWFGLAPAGTPVFGLPGNPVSALVSFELLVRPAVRRLCGAPLDAAAGPGAADGNATLAAAAAPTGERETWLRARLETDTAGSVRAIPEAGQGSHMLSGLARAQGLVVLPPGTASLPEGTSVPLHRLEWFER
jgi:molybdopterin molybdotransferase